MSKTDKSMTFLRQAKTLLGMAMQEVEHALLFREEGFPLESGRSTKRARSFTQGASGSFDAIERVFAKE